MNVPEITTGRRLLATHLKIIEIGELCPDRYYYQYFSSSNLNLNKSDIIGQTYKIPMLNNSVYLLFCY